MAYEFDNVLNFRDVGKTVNDFLGRRIVREGVLYRSARPDDATPCDRERLRDELGIKTVMDLRTKTEHAMQARKREANLRVPTLLQSDAALAGPVQIHGMRYLEIRITGRRFERFLLSQLSWLGFFQCMILYILGYRMQAVCVICKQVMLPRGLVGLGLDTIDQSGAEIAGALRAFTKPTSLPLLVHCTQGKDRTGLIIILILMVLDVPVKAITHDYLLSQDGLQSEREARLAEIKEIGLTPEWGDAPEDFVARLDQHLSTRYGGIDGYLDTVEFGDAERCKLVEALGA